MFEEKKVFRELKGKTAFSQDFEVLNLMIFAKMNIRCLKRLLTWVLMILDISSAYGSSCGCDHCPKSDGGNELKVYKCGNEIFTDTFLDASTGTFSSDKFCMAYDDRFVMDSNTSFVISADLLNYQSANGPNFGHVGLAFNLLDINTYEGLYLRVHTSSTCIQWFEDKTGTVNTYAGNSCVGRPVGRKWFTLKIVVDNGLKIAKVYIDGILQNSGSQPLKLPAMPRGAIVVANGYKNTAFYRKFQIIKT